MHPVIYPVAGRSAELNAIEKLPFPMYFWRPTKPTLKWIPAPLL